MAATIWANYNVNVCLTKTMIRRMVTFLCSRFDDEVGSILRDIVDTPVSPELLPPDESGKIQQKTEDILGSYELHDFFLYYLLRCSFPPRQALLLRLRRLLRAVFRQLHSGKAQGFPEPLLCRTV